MAEDDLNREIVNGLARAEKMIQLQRMKQVFLALFSILLIAIVCCILSLSFLWFFGDAIIYELGL